VTSKVRVESFAISLDGFGAGPDQGPHNPNGIGGLAVHGWAFGTRTFQAMFGKDGGATGTDDDFVARGFRNIGAWVMGRNMFGAVRGPWPDDSWKGWWGDNPPFHCPVFVLTHHPRASVEMQAGTVFHFVTDGLPAAVRLALEAAEGRDVRLGGGVATVQHGLQAGLIDEMHVAIAPVLLGRGERLFAGVDMVELGYECAEHVASPSATHVVLRRRSQRQAEPGAAPDPARM
jgi:dihydrofolate reductase